MTRQEVYTEIQEAFGLVPTMFKHIPDNTLEEEWRLFRRLQIDESAIPGKYRELIGIGIAAAMRCKFCSLYHTEMAKLMGATDQEIEEAVHFAKCSAGWSAYVNGMQLDYDQFKQEIQQACQYVREHQGMQLQTA
ncbi:MAG TPA: carboxymuconolactone decarboxylase family protein [Planctomycetota bacterium]|jgi:AhpD family alkylhydroperoxidase